MPYSYKYTPKGDQKDTVIQWIRSQKNKTDSLNLLILRAVHEYGNQDIVDLMTKAFLNNQISSHPDNHQSVVPPTEQPQPVVTPKVEPQSVSNNNQNPQKPKPNLGFLSNKK